MPAQMSLTRDNDVVQTLAPDRSYQPFGKAILPRRGRCNRLVSNAHGSQSAGDDGAIDPIAITDHVPRSTCPRKTLVDLACDPLRRRLVVTLIQTSSRRSSRAITKPYSSLNPM